MNEQWRNTELWVTKTEQGEHFTPVQPVPTIERIVKIVVGGSMLAFIAFAIYLLVLVSTTTPLKEYLFNLLWILILFFLLFVIGKKAFAYNILLPIPHLKIYKDQLVWYYIKPDFYAKKIDINTIQNIEIKPVVFSKFRFLDDNGRPLFSKIQLPDNYHLIIYSQGQQQKIPFEFYHKESAEKLKSYILNPSFISEQTVEQKHADTTFDLAPYLERTNSTYPVLKITIPSKNYWTKEAFYSVVAHYTLTLALPLFLICFTLYFSFNDSYRLLANLLFFPSLIFFFRNLRHLSEVESIKFKVDKQAIKRYRTPIPLFEQLDIRKQNIADIYVATYGRSYRVHIADLKGGIHNIPLDFPTESTAEALQEKINEIFDYIPPAERLKQQQ